MQVLSDAGNHVKSQRFMAGVARSLLSRNSPSGTYESRNFCLRMACSKEAGQPSPWSLPVASAGMNQAYLFHSSANTQYERSIHWDQCSYRPRFNGQAVYFDSSTSNS
jgi:hypothetical protein